MSSNKQPCKQKYIFLDRLKHNAKTQPWGLAKKIKGGRATKDILRGIERLISKHRQTFEVIKKSQYLSIRS